VAEKRDTKRSLQKLPRIFGRSDWETIEKKDQQSLRKKVDCSEDRHCSRWGGDDDVKGEQGTQGEKNNLGTGKTVVRRRDRRQFLLGGRKEEGPQAKQGKLNEDWKAPSTTPLSREKEGRGRYAGAGSAAEEGKRGREVQEAKKVQKVYGCCRQLRSTTTERRCEKEWESILLKRQKRTRFKRGGPHPTVSKH